MSGRALIIGGSVGGLFAAAMLRKTGWETLVFERSSGDLAGRGAGIGVTEELINAVRDAGADFDPSIGVPVRSFLWLGPDGSVQRDFYRPMTASAWGRIYTCLRPVVPASAYRAGMELTHVSQDDAGVTGHFANGESWTGDVLIAADGSLSTVRRQFLPDVGPQYAGYVAWRGIADAADLPAETRAVLDGHIVIGFHDRQVILSMTVPAAEESERSDRRRTYFIWYRPTNSAADMRDLFTDADGVDHGAAIPPPKIRDDVIKTMRNAAETALAPQLRPVIHAARQPLLQAISDLSSPQLVFRRVALLGDSAFVARPHVAAGITKAAMDARVLANALSTHGNVDDALSAYERDRLEFGQAIVTHARRLGSFIEDQAEAGQERFLDPNTILAEYGAPHLVKDPAPDTLTGAGPS